VGGGGWREREKRKRKCGMCEHVVFVYFSCTNYWISLCLKSAKIARKLMKANLRNSFADFIHLNISEESY